MRGVTKEIHVAIAKREYAIMCHQCRVDWLRVFSFLVLNAIFALFGALTFSAMERTNEETMCREAQTEFRDFLESLEPYDNGTYLVTPDHLRELVRHTEHFAHNGLSVADYDNCPDLWTFSGALYFCFTIGTTIGYGETAPSTFNGRLVFMFYVIPAICLCGAFVSEIGRLMYRALHRGAVSVT